MRIAFFSTRSYDREFFDRANEKFGHKMEYFESRLTPQTVRMAEGYPGVCAFVNDELNSEVLRCLAEGGTYAVALRSSGFNNVDVEAANRYDIAVMRVPEYSPYSVAEHTVGLILALNRKVHRAYMRVREWNFSLEGLLGFDLHGRTAGIIGTGKIGIAVARILAGFGCKLLGYDVTENEEAKSLGMRYTNLAELFAESDIITLHAPLTPDTYHLLDKGAFEQMKDGVMIINTGRGALIDTVDAIEALKSHRIGYLGIDVYEEESSIFYRDLSDKIIGDDVLARLMTFPNVIITSHQGFFTRDALTQIAETTLANFSEVEQGRIMDKNAITTDHIRELVRVTE